MLLAVDAGNSNIVFGLYRKEQWHHQWRLSAHSELTVSRISESIETELKKKNIEGKNIENAVLSCVVPQITNIIIKGIFEKTGILPIILDAGTDTGIQLETPNPEQVGTDLIANAAGAYHLVNDDCMIVDFGTATTIMVVKNPGRLIGGTISAGLETSIKCLVDDAALLSEIPIEVPGRVVADNTEGAMQSGLVLGHIAMVEGLVIRIRQETAVDKVVATGGLCQKIAVHTNIFEYIEPDLTLEGLRIIAEKSGTGGRE